MKRFTLLLLVFVSLWAAPAFAGSGDLIKYTPKSTKLVMGANLDALKPSPLYREMLALVKGRPAFAEFLSFLEVEAGINIEKDVQGVAVAMPEVSMNPAQANAQDTMTLVVSGKFDRKRLLEAVDKKFPGHPITGEGPTARHTLGTVTLAFASDKELVMTVGDQDFQDKTWNALANKKESASSNKDITTMAGKLNLTRGMWLIGVTGHLPQNGPKMNVAGMTVDLASGLKIDLIGTMNGKEDVKKSLADFEMLKKEATNPMVTMMGAAPLIQNLKTGSKGLDVTMTTQMNAAQFQNMMGMLMTTLAAGSKPIAPPTQPQPEATPQQVPAKGADADFN
jgi:hypothetical protein